jgi:hypothetical protein
MIDKLPAMFARPLPWLAGRPGKQKIRIPGVPMRDEMGGWSARSGIFFKQKIN